MIKLFSTQHNNLTLFCIFIQKYFRYFAAKFKQILSNMKKEMVLIEVSELERIVKSAVRDEFTRTIDSNSLGTTQVEGYYNTNELAELLSVDRTTLWVWEKKGLLKAKRVGKKKLYSRKEINDLVESGKLGRYCRA